MNNDSQAQKRESRSSPENEMGSRNPWLKSLLILLIQFMIFTGGCAVQSHVNIYVAAAGGDEKSEFRLSGGLGYAGHPKDYMWIPFVYYSDTEKSPTHTKLWFRTTHDRKQLVLRINKLSYISESRSEDIIDVPVECTLNPPSTRDPKIQPPATLAAVSKLPSIDHHYLRIHNTILVDADTFIVEVDGVLKDQDEVLENYNIRLNGKRHRWWMPNMVWCHFGIMYLA